MMEILIDATTSELESFNIHILMYAPKRNAFSYAVYRCRCQLAAIDYSKHLNRPFCWTKKEIRGERVHSKAAGNWSTRPMKKPKEYTYITGLITEVTNEFTIGKKRISGKCEQLS
ncbi:hypothetical protein DPMN_101405 [Dreissena polymorpha]|uniref:Uncharacterized protein n=1 Tax=Dreissena polymorpha TaxID=45954 RepID=A0A9D4LL24_DREPO|nr:hypothetical protein DPMN_101405 [Dreissena polymorpha]